MRTTRLVPATLRGPAGSLEALLQIREPPEHPIAAVVCHPHPLYGGTLNNKVVHRVASVLLEQGAAVLRFNFRGVGKSAGEFDGEAEIEDARVALGFMRERFPAARQWLAGFSFGAWVASRLAGSEPDIERLVLVAPGVLTGSFEVLRTSSIPKLVVAGTRDEICPWSAVEREFSTWAEPKRLLKVDGATHFFDRQLGDLGKVLAQALSEPAGSTS